MRVRVSAALFVICLVTLANDAVSVDSVVAAVRTSMSKKRKDGAIAEALDKMKLAERLDDRVIEILESEGAGPQTLGALQRMRDGSRLLPAPADPPPGMTPAPPLSSEEEHRLWQTAAGKAQDYTRSLPDFLCTETMHRWVDPTSKEDWRAVDTVVADVSFVDQKENYMLRTVGGKRSDRSLTDLDGTVSQGEFGSILAMIFNPASQAEYRWDHWTILRKRTTSVYFYRITAAHHPHELWHKTPPSGVAKAVVGLHGYVYIDQETSSVMRISAIAEEIPTEFPVQASSTVLDYEYAKIGDSPYLLPLRAEVRIDAKGGSALNGVEFQNYRKFRADTMVSFDKK
jgi:hypothetical protein